MSNTNFKDPNMTFASGGKNTSAPRPEDATTGASGAFDEAKAKASSMAGDAGKSMRDFAERQKDAGADAIKGAANAVRDAADRFEDRAPGVTQVARKVSDNLEAASKSLHETSLDALGRSIADFARERPLAAMAGAFVAGLVVSRLFGGRSS